MPITLYGAESWNSIAKMLQTWCPTFIVAVWFWFRLALNTDHNGVLGIFGCIWVWLPGWCSERLLRHPLHWHINCIPISVLEVFTNMEVQVLQRKPRWLRAILGWILRHDLWDCCWFYFFRDISQHHIVRLSDSTSSAFRQKRCENWEDEIQSVHRHVSFWIQILYTTVWWR